MPERPGCHLDYDDRCVIEEGIEAGLSASAIARRLEVSPSTVTREVKANRHGRPSRAKAVRPARKCANYDGCRRFRDVCGSCSQEGRRGACRLCGLASCPDLCPDFAPRVCALLDRWPYLCRCDKARRARCDLPKFRYDARKAQESSDGRLVHSRTGISISEEELASMLDAVAPLIRNGLSPEAVWLGLGDRLPVGVRTFYSWMESGVVDVPAIHLPRKVRCRPRRKRRGGAPGRALEGRGYAEFCALPLAEQARAAEMDSVAGRAGSSARILSVHFVASSFQFYLRLPDATSRSVVGDLDMLERALGSPEAFGAGGPPHRPRERVLRPPRHRAQLPRARQAPLQGLLLRPAGPRAEGRLRAQPFRAAAHPAQGALRLRRPDLRRPRRRSEPRQLVPPRRPGRQMPGRRGAGPPARGVRGPAGRGEGPPRGGGAEALPAAARGGPMSLPALR